MGQSIINIQEYGDALRNTGYKNIDYNLYICYNGVRFGGVAQLVERLNGIQKVRGSTPLTSTTTFKPLF